jgi:lysophospholipase L1-like esterase
LSPGAREAGRRGEGRKLVAVVAGALLVSALAGEIALRAWHRVAHGIPFGAVLAEPPPRRFLLSPFLVFGPIVGRQLPGKQRPELATWNAQGFRSPDALGPKPAGELRIITLGGSTTEDQWNEEGIHWSWVLEQELHARGLPQARVYNGGSSAWSTAHLAVRLAFDVPAYEPDFVLVMENINDLTASYFAAQAGVPLDPNYLVKYGADFYTRQIREQDLSYSRLWATLRERSGRLFPPPDAPVPENVDLAAGRRLYERNLRTLGALARANGIQLVLLTQPFTDEPELDRRMRLPGQWRGIDPFAPHERLLADLALYNGALLEVGRREGIPAIDMAGLLGKDPRLYVDVVHYGAEGSRAFGEKLAGALEPLLSGAAPAARAAR